ncbi:histidinol-phosphatase [bacterium]|nr:histidinol-phosphatase [bacterium]
MSRDRSRELHVAREAVELAGRFALEHFGRDLEVERKADASPVTVADRGAEEILRRHLAQAFPDDGLLGEEHGESPGRSGRRWILDPIDGTQSFVRGVPLWGVLVGLEEEGRCVVGVIGLPALDRTLWAATGQGAFCNGERISVSAATSLADATLLTSDTRPQHYAERWTGFERLLRGVGRQRGWGDCYGYALVATGRAEVMVDPQLNPWDSAAVVPIVEEAGGAFFAWDGSPTIYGNSGIAVPRALREPVLALLRG